MRFTPTPNMEHDIERGKLKITFLEMHDRQGVEGSTFRQRPAFLIQYESKQSFEVVRKDIGRIQILMTLCIDSPVEVDRVRLWRNDENGVMLDGSDSGNPQEIELIATVARWLDRSSVYQRVLDSMISTKHAKRMYAENRFLNVTYAAEAFHRIVEPGRHMPQDEFESLFQAYMAVTPEFHQDWLRDKLSYANDSPPLITRLVSLQFAPLLQRRIL